MNKIKTLHELAKENPDKTYNELTKIKEEKEKIQEDEENYYQTGMVYVPREDELKDDRGPLDLTKQIESLNEKITDLLNENDGLRDLVKSKDYTKHHDYKFLVDENKKLHKEVDDLKHDNKRLARHVEDQIDRTRKAGF